MIKVFLGLSTTSSFFFATLSLFTLIASLYRKVRFSSAENAGLRSIVLNALGILPRAYGMSIPSSIPPPLPKTAI